MSAAAAVTLLAVAPGGASEPLPWTGYGAGFDAIDSVAWAASSITVSTGSDAATAGFGAAHAGYDAAMDTVRPPDKPEPQDDTCWFWVSMPSGGYDADGRLQAHVIAQVDCNFIAERITYLTEFHGNDNASGSFIRTGRTVTCYNTNHCQGSIAEYYSNTPCTGRFDHWGVGYGHFWNERGDSIPVLKSGDDGPHKTGTSYNKNC